MYFYQMIFIFLGILISFVTAGDLLTIGTKAPDFELPDAYGNLHKLSDYRGKIIVLYFYPKNGTPGCTKEACNLRDNYEVLQKRGLVILGISYDDAESHQNFIEENQLPFVLLSDTEKQVSELYGAKGGMLGFIGAKRITYLIDESGEIMHIFDKVDTGAHSQQILEVLDKMSESDELVKPDSSQNE